MDNREFLNRREAADFLARRGYPVTKGTLQKLGSVGNGPTYRIFGNRSLYKPEDLIAWAEARCSEPKQSA